MSNSVQPHRRQATRPPIPGILQARTLGWVAISSSNAWKWKVKVKSLSRVWLFATPWTAAHQASPSMGFFKHTERRMIKSKSPLSTVSYMFLPSSHFSPGRNDFPLFSCFCFEFWFLEVFFTLLNDMPVVLFLVLLTLETFFLFSAVATENLTHPATLTYQYNYSTIWI